ncbi:hypothetical protein ACFX1R_031996 [Malus domestica]
MWEGTPERRWVGSPPKELGSAGKLAERSWEKAKAAIESEGSEGMPEELQEKWSEKKQERVAEAAALWGCWWV